MPVKLTTKEFIEKAINMHGNKYNYSKVEYINTNTKVIIICNIHMEFEQTPVGHLQGKGCRKCSVIMNSDSKRSNKIKFIEKSKLIHGEKYDYSKVKYINANTKVVIICNIHGEFQQTPHHHLNKHNCYKCGAINGGIKNKKYTTQQFINKAIIIHKAKYDYCKSEYNNADSNIIIICKIHGEFLQSPRSHLNGAGCQICSNCIQSSTKDFIPKANIKHNFKYDYSKVYYIKCNINIIIICNIHGEFLQTPSNHLTGYGCSKCSTANATLSVNDFIQRSNVIHNNKYDYSNIEYVNAYHKIIIKCPIHGDFTQVPATHLYKKSGCSKCSNKGFSKKQIQWLDLLSKLNNIYIQHAMNEGEFNIPTTKYKADGYCKETNTIYEFYGDYWHGNINIYEADKIHQICKKTYGKLYNETIDREQEIKDLGYNVITIWEYNWNNINKAIKTLQLKFRSKK
jgi:hypothetical protein